MEARRLTPAVSASRWPSAPAGSLKPSACSRERAESGAEALGDPRLLRRQPRDRPQQRPVEQLLVQPPDLADPAQALAAEGGLGGLVDAPTQPEAQRQGAQLRRVLGQQVGAAQARELQPVLQTAQEAIGLGEARGVLPTDVAPVDEGLQRRQRGDAAQRRVGTAVHQLQQLHAELDVAQSPGAELDLALGDPLGQVRLDPAAHRLHVGDEVRPRCRRPDQRRHRRDVGLAQGDVPRGRARLEQRLELPRLRPALVVRLVAGERPHQRSVLALRAQVGVHRPRGLLAAGRGGQAQHPGGQLGGGRHRPGLVAVGERLGDEHHVHVADVVELPAPALAHRHDRQPAGLRAGGQLGGCQREQPAERGGGEVGELPRDVLDRDPAARPALEVPGGDAEQLAAVGPAQRVRALAAGERRSAPAAAPRRRLPLRDPHRPEHDLAQPQRAGAHRRGGVVGEQRQVVGVAHQVVAEGLAGAEHPQEPQPGARVAYAAASRTSPGRGMGLQQPEQLAHGEVGVRQLREGRDHHGGVLPVRVAVVPEVQPAGPGPSSVSARSGSANPSRVSRPRRAPARAGRPERGRPRSGRSPSERMRRP